jgi:hypothetical protein
MKITYIIESNDGQICQIEKSFSHMMRLLLKLGSDYHAIRLKGPYLGEGFHTHKYTVINGKVKRAVI